MNYYDENIYKLDLASVYIYDYKKIHKITKFANNINDKDKINSTLLFVLCKYKDIFLLNILLNRSDLDINILIYDSPLLFYYTIFDMNVLNLLLNHNNININLKNNSNSNFFMFLLKNEYYNEENDTKIKHSSPRFNKYYTIFKLIKMKIDINAIDNNGHNILTLLCLYNFDDVIFNKIIENYEDIDLSFNKIMNIEPFYINNNLINFKNVKLYFVLLLIIYFKNKIQIMIYFKNKFEKLYKYNYIETIIDYINNESPIHGSYKYTKINDNNTIEEFSVIYYNDNINEDLLYINNKKKMLKILNDINSNTKSASSILKKIL